MRVIITVFFTMIASLCFSQEYYKVTANILNVREYPNTDSLKLFALKYGDMVKSIENIGTWYKIEYQGQQGYVYSKYLTEVNNDDEHKSSSNNSEVSAIFLLLIIILIFWFIPPFIVGNWGSSREIGFWIPFLVSIFFSFIVAIIVVAASSKKIELFNYKCNYCGWSVKSVPRRIDPFCPQCGRNNTGNRKEDYK